MRIVAATVLALPASLLLLSACPLPAAPLDVNACNYSELLAVPGLGPRLADALLDEQSTHGDFRSPADLARVPGIGPCTAVRLGAHFEFPALAAPASRFAEDSPAACPEAAAPGVRREAVDHSPPSLAGASPCAAATEPVDLNSASEEALTALPGIGKVLAARLVQFRKQHGRLRGPADLARIRGLGGRRGQALTGLVVFR